MLLRPVYPRAPAAPNTRGGDMASRTHIIRALNIIMWMALLANAFLIADSWTH